MAKYIVDVHANNTALNFTPWWENFMSSIVRAEYSLNEFNDALSRHNAVDILGTKCIEFDTEEDFLIFKLKFS